MEEQYYWIEINFSLFGFWGTVFKFSQKVKKIKEKMLNKTGFYAFKFILKNRIRNPD